MDKQNEKGMVDLLNQETKELQDNQKQIEEMVLAVYPWLKEIPMEERKQLSKNVSGLMVMERLYNAGYRKIPENAVVVSKQVWEEHIENFDKCREAIEERVRKETAEKFAEMANELLDKQEKGWSANMIWIITVKNCIDEICKEFIKENK